MAEYAGQSITHTIVAAGVVAALLRVWRVGEPDLRVAFRILPLAFPTLVLPAFLVLAPQRSAAAFRDRWALFAGERWGALEIGDVGVGRSVLVALALIGIGLLALDLARALSERRETRVVQPLLPTERTREIVWELDQVAGALGARAPRLLVLDTAASVLFVTGVRRPVLVISRGALERLDPRERRAALAHEVAHVARRDPWLGWGFLVLRFALCFNPAVQVVVRLAARELEWRADDLAASATGDLEALGSALAKLSAVEGGRRAPRAWRVAGLAGELFRHGRYAAVEARRARLRRARGEATRPFGAVRVGTTVVGLALLLFFVV